MFNRETSTTRALLISLGLILDVTTMVEDYLIPIRKPWDDLHKWRSKIIVNGFAEYTYAIFMTCGNATNHFESSCREVDLDLVYAFVISGIADLSRGAALAISTMHNELAAFLIAICHNTICYPFKKFNIAIWFVHFCRKYDIRGLEKLPITGNMDFLTYAADILIGANCLIGIKILLKKCDHHSYNELLTWIRNISSAENHPEIHRCVTRKLNRQ